MAWVIGVDGGTFTDFYALDDQGVNNASTTSL